MAILSAIFLLVMLLLFLFSLLEKNPKISNLIALILLAVLIPVLTIRTVIRDGNWRSGLILYGHDIKYTNGDNANLENNYGVELFRIGNVAEAKAHFEKSVSLMDDWSVSQNNLGVVFEQTGDLEKAKSYYERSVSLSDYYLAYQNLAGVLSKLKRDDEAKNFIESPSKNSLMIPIYIFSWP